MWRFSIKGKTLNKRNRFHWPWNPFLLVGMKDFVKIQYSTLWNLSFDQSYFSANGNQFFLHFLETPASFSTSSGKVFVKEILISA